VPRFSVAGAFLEGLATRDFERLGSALCDDVHLRALLPPGLFEWDGTDDVRAAFARWFGDVEQFELVDAIVGEVGQRLHLRWRVRLQAERLGDGWFVVEQQAYADTDGSDRIQHLSLLCSGYCPERTKG
jgi:ketosteroid isomerase-like protein